MAAKVVNIEFVQQDQDVNLRLALLSAVERFLGRGRDASAPVLLNILRLRIRWPSGKDAKNRRAQPL
jgi:hypothetical protein